MTVVAYQLASQRIMVQLYEVDLQAISCHLENFATNGAIGDHLGVDYRASS